MKVDVKSAEPKDGSGITIEPRHTLGTVDFKYTSIYLNNVPEHCDQDELWIFKRKAFLKAVAKALGVAIYEPVDGYSEPGYYR